MQAGEALRIRKNLAVVRVCPRVICTAKKTTLLKKPWSRFLVCTVSVLVLLCLVPYLVPLHELPRERRDLACLDSEFFTVRGVEVHYRRRQGGGGLSGNVLLVHGFGGSTFSWRETIPYLVDEGYRVVALDLPGFGLSERLSGLDHSPDERGALSWALLDALYPGEAWHLVGHSMGGATVAAMALAEPERVKSVTFAAGALGGTNGRLEKVVSFPPLQRLIRVVASRLLMDEGRVESMIESAYGRKPSPEEVAGYYLPVTIKDSDLVLVELLRSGSGMFEVDPAALTVPVLCLWGEQDAWVPLEEGEELARVIPGAKLEVVAGEGHCVMETAPACFNRKLVNFISGRGER